MARHDSLTAAREEVARLIQAPPLDLAELKERLSGHPKDELRRALIERLEQDAVPEHLHVLHAAAMKEVKPGNLRGRISAIAVDQARPIALRALALDILLQTEAAEARRISTLITEEDRLELVSVPLRSMAHAALTEEHPGRALRQSLTGTPVLDRVLLFEIESARKQHSVSAAELYGPALEAGLIQDHRESLATILGSEGGDDAVALLERLRDSAGDDEEYRRACQDALLRARTASIAATRPAASAPTPGRAWVTTADGEGAFTLIAEFPGRSSLGAFANPCIGASREIRGGFTDSGTADEMDGIVRQFEEFSRVVPVPAGVAATLAIEAIERSRRMGKRIPKDARRSAKLLAQVEAAPLAPWPCEPGPLPTLEEMLALLAAARHRRTSWFFDDGDLNILGCRPQMPGHDSPAAFQEWIEATTASMDTPEMRSRMLEILRHEARCLAWVGEMSEAARFVALGQQVENGLRHSPFALAWVIRGIEPATMDEDMASLVGLVGDPLLRRGLRSEFFSAVERPRGRDLARLDLTEVVFLALLAAVADIPGQRRPPEAQLRIAANELGIMAADDLMARREPRQSLEAIGDRLPDLLGITPDQAAPLHDEISHCIGTFILEFCAQCSIACIATPDKAMRKAFFAEDHPAF